MKFNTQLYKLSIFTENICEECANLKNILKDNGIPFSDRSITTKTDEEKKINGDNRWDFIDLESEDTRFQWFTPVLIIEDSEGNITYIPSVQDTVNCDGGICINNVTLDNLKTALKPYLV
tara:strand:- start:525 stop:884 length:360 start_codon:yes stop_codon:yes gene_type:complete